METKRYRQWAFQLEAKKWALQLMGDVMAILWVQYYDGLSVVLTLLLYLNAPLSY